MCFSVFCNIPFVNDTQKIPIQSEYTGIIIVFQSVYKVWSIVLQVVQGLKTLSGQVPRLLQACFSSHFLQPLRENWIITVGCRKEDYIKVIFGGEISPWKPYHFMQLKIKSH